MDRTRLPGLGLGLIGLMMLGFGVMDAVRGQPEELPSMALSTIGLWVAAFGLRDHVAFPGERTVAVGITMWAVAQCTKLVLLPASAGIYLLPFGLFALGSVISAVATWRWFGAIGQEEVSRMLPVRVGVAVFGLGLVGLVSLQLIGGRYGLPLLLLLLGVFGASLFVASFVAPTQRDSLLGSTDGGPTA